MSGEAKDMSDARRKSSSPSGKLQRESKEVPSKGEKTAARTKRKAARTRTAAAKDATTAGGRARASVENGRQAAASAVGQISATAVTTWTAVKKRKTIAAGVGAGVIGVVGAAFAAGRTTAKPRTGPLTRMVHSRI
ncbi:hypothetical protein [Streptomyces sp. NPDC020742]|uniref:hypothetical protein n=1 Tax=Streptomyces sp. NPDC020742 TaxID=3154897 RepID=UPI00340312E3